MTLNKCGLKNSSSPWKTVGILGGLGPEATASFFYKIVAKTPARKDQEHIPMVIFSNPKIPDRSASCLRGQNDVFISLIDGIKFLINSKVNLIAIPCVSSHLYYQELIEGFSIPILNIVDETTSYVANNKPEIQKIGILATTVTINKMLFTNAFNKFNIDTIVPRKEIQENSVMPAIYFIKAGEKKRATEMIDKAIRELVARGAQAIVAGCTEISLIANPGSSSVPVIDALDCLADAVVREAFQVKLEILC
jgi:aspartate racemase